MPELYKDWIILTCCSEWKRWTTIFRVKFSTHSDELIPDIIQILDVTAYLSAIQRRKRLRKHTCVVWYQARLKSIIKSSASVGHFTLVWKQHVFAFLSVFMDEDINYLKGQLCNIWHPYNNNNNNKVSHPATASFLPDLCCDYCSGSTWRLCKGMKFIINFC